MGYNFEIMRKVKVRMRGDHLANRIIEDCVLWEREVTGGVERGIRDIEIGAKLSEEDFYRCYLRIRLVIDGELYGREDVKERDLEVLIGIMMKGEDWVMSSDGRNGKQGQLAKELGKSIKLLYSSFARLKAGGYLVTTEDRFIELSSDLIKLRRALRRDLSEGLAFGLSYVMNFIISE